ncbi:MAG: hypothetical protein JXA14_26330 [Anaerolineae bacterium]|nr:hypothetical protein [Anaerolineae bacterium]
MASTFRQYWSRFLLALKAFQESFFASQHVDPDDFTDPDARRLRYAVLWSYYENTAYREIHSWSELLKHTFGLYRYTRNIYNPTTRLCNFHQTHIWGGRLDREAGPGIDAPSALPIEETESEGLRQAIARLWQWSNWSIKKDMLTLFGAVMGDVGIRIVDDTDRSKVYMQVLHPATLWNVERDPFGNVKGYEIREERTHPQNSSRTAVYSEVAGRDGDDVVYQTFLDGDLYPWNGEAAEWREPYGFVPLVVVQHNDVGLDWGWAEIFPSLSKVREVDDLASLVSDQVRKSVNPLWFFSGVAKTSQITISLNADTQTGSPAKPEAGREDVPFLTHPSEGAKATALVAPLNIAGAMAWIQAILQDLESDYPELSFERLRLQGAVSGMSLRVARQPAEAKLTQRRALYDDALVRAQQMAVAIGGFRGYEGFQGFDLDSYGAGDLDHSIGQRPVFAENEIERIEGEKTFWEAAKVAGEAGVPLSAFLDLQGWPDDKIELIHGSEEYQQRQEMRRAALAGFEAMEGAASESQADDEEEEDDVE